MMAMSKKMLDQEPSEIEMLLPWHAAGTLNARDARRVDEALARDPELAKQYAVIREEYAETIHLNESLGAPSARAMQKLFDAIDGEPVRKPSVTSRIATRIAEFFGKLSPRTMAWSAGAAALALLLQAGVIGAVLMKNQGCIVPDGVAEHERAGCSMTRDLAGGITAARTGALCARSPDGRYQRVARQLSGLDRRRRQWLVPPAIRQQGDGQGRSRKPDRQTAQREDRQSRGSRAVRAGAMLDGRVIRRIKNRHVAVALVIAALPFAYFDTPAALAQNMNMMRTPNVNIGTRTPTINPTVTPRIDANIAGRTNVVTGVDRLPSRVTTTTSTMRVHRINPNSTMPYARYSPNLYPVCQAANRDGDGECSGKPVASGDGGGSGKSAKKGKGIRYKFFPGRHQPAPASPIRSWPRSTVR